MEIAQRILPVDDSSLQWSPAGGGLTQDPQKTLEDLYNRLVVRYDDQPSRIGRSDDEVWKSYRSTLESRNVLNYLKPKEICVEDDQVEFQYAWKNGFWHCLEPLSFDLSSPDSIRDKAHRWLGHITSVQNAEENFMVYFLLGEPKQEDLQDALEKAISILKKVPVKNEIIREQDATNFSEQFASEIEGHLIT
jgi:hypothetical protein